MAEKHVHKYELVDIGVRNRSRKVYKCALPACSHYMPHKKLVLGKESICWKCGNVFILTTEVIIRHPRVRPTCFSCIKGTHLTPEEKVSKKQEDDKLDAAIDLLAALRGDLK